MPILYGLNLVGTAVDSVVARRSSGEREHTVLYSRIGGDHRFYGTLVTYKTIAVDGQIANIENLQIAKPRERTFAKLPPRIRKRFEPGYQYQHPEEIKSIS